MICGGWNNNFETYIRNKSVVWLLVFSCLFDHWVVAGNGNASGSTMQQMLHTVALSDTLAYTIDLEDEDGVYLLLWLCVHLINGFGLLPTYSFFSDFRDYFRICPWTRSVF